MSAICLLPLICPSLFGTVDVVDLYGNSIYICVDGEPICPPITGPFDNAVRYEMDCDELEERYGCEKGRCCGVGEDQGGD